MSSYYGPRQTKSDKSTDNGTVQAHPTGSYSYKNWTTELQAFESEWEDEIWGQNGESWSTVGSPVATIKAARTKWDQYLRVPVPM